MSRHTLVCDICLILEGVRLFYELHLKKFRSPSNDS